MDKLTTISATLFLAADIFAIVSLAMPDWIVTDVGGKMRFRMRPKSAMAVLIYIINKKLKTFTNFFR